VPAIQPEQWRIETNKRYSEIVSSVTTLATGSLVIPIALIRQIVGVKEGEAIGPKLSWHVYVSWITLGLSVLLGLSYSWLSAKWIKAACGQKTALGVTWLERLMDWLFVLMLLSFVVGIVLLVRFAWRLFA
jgi:hypothetical protein